MRFLVAVAIGGALGTTVLPHLPEPNGRDTPFFWLRREFTYHQQLWHPLQGYPRWSKHPRQRFE